ncbi:nSTAND1 domain-containing NTPase [Pseudoduganella chitinolytica]|uniref:Winged helix-turn-helix domain-containing protein n=1 Tax=Pseudoduganella chitinolytica TaxID=34070 RepID=A0ABY8BDX3_9BURK|nr:winged helix-turn-helix domain-containing protein [Pseudoduganella chitinolytica]WEF34030.1 winged helix-turn-helix domain-containing protein [Pseudoduganella chitinolytica]
MGNAERFLDRGFDFGAWRVEPGSNSLYRDGQRRQLEPRAMEVLVLLCRHAGEVLSADAILDTCWGGVPTGDNPLHKILTQLRHALGDSATAPSYIETIRKRGYRAIADVRVEPRQQAWAGTPFRGLAAFGRADAAIFHGRRQATEQLLQVVRQQVEGGCAMVAVLGPSGSGKSSLVQAGLLARLHDTPLPGLPLADTLTLDCADLGSASLFDALGSVLLDAELDGDTLFGSDSAAGLGARLRDDMVSLTAALQARLGLIGLGLFVDHLEAIYRHPHVSDGERATFIGALEALARTGRILVVLACRNDFYPELMTSAPLCALKARGGHFDLAPPGPSEIAQIIRLPAQAAGLRFETDEASGARLDDVLCSDAAGSGDMLPLLEYCLHELYRRRGEEGLLTFAVYRELGGIEGSIGARAEQVVAALGPAEVAALPRVLSQLASVADNQLAVTARAVPWSTLRTGPEQALVQALVDARLFVTDLAAGVATYGIAHEALLRRWPRAVEWIDRHRQALQELTRTGTQAARWHAAGRPADLLLPPGQQARQAARLLALPEFSLPALERDFIQASLGRARRSERLRLLVAGTLLLLALLAIGLGIAAQGARQKAERHRGEAEALMAYMLGEFVDRLRPLGRLDLLDSVSTRALGYLADAEREHGSPVELTQRAKALQLIAEVKQARADPAAARSALTSARAILQQQRRELPRSRDVLVNYGANAFMLGQLHFDANELDKATSYFLEYRDVSDAVAALAPDDPAAWIEQSYAANTLGTLALQQGRPEAAAIEFARSVQLKGRALAARPGDAQLQADLADSLSWLATARERLGDLAQAAALYEHQETLLRALHRAKPGDGLWTHRYALALWQKGELLVALGRDGAATAALAHAAELFGRLVEQDASNRSWQAERAGVRLPLAWLAPDAPTALRQARAAAHEFETLAALEPKKVHLAGLAASARVAEAAAQHRADRLPVARQVLTPALARLTALHATAPETERVLESLVHGWLTAAALYRSERDTARMRQACAHVQDLLGPVAAANRDYRVLSAWVLSQHCLGTATRARAEEAALMRMGYRASAYVGALRTLQPESVSLTPP